MPHEITIKPAYFYGNSADGVEVLVDGKPFRGVKSVHTEHAAGEVPAVTTTIIPSVCSVETCAELNLRIDIDDVRSAVQCLQFAMMLDDELKGGAIKSIESVLREESVTGINHTELSVKIADRVFGLEQ